MSLQEVSTIQPADEALVAELERLLAEAKEGRARAILYVISRSGGEPMRWGSIGRYDLRDFALGVKMLELELDATITAGGTEG